LKPKLHLILPNLSSHQANFPPLLTELDFARTHHFSLRGLNGILAVSENTPPLGSLMFPSYLVPSPAFSPVTFLLFIEDVPNSFPNGLRSSALRNLLMPFPARMW